jgi:Trp operon repressor
MKVEQVFSDRKRFLDLLLLADEQEDMIDRYLKIRSLYMMKTSSGRFVWLLTRGKEFTN